MTTEPAKQSKSTVIGLLILVAIFVVLCGGCYIVRNALTAGPSAPSGPTAIDAYVMSQQFLNKQLKAPATAKYPSMNDPDVKIVNVSAGRWSVTAYVDSENSFGALIRTKYIAVLDYVGNDNWRLVSLTTP